MRQTPGLTAASRGPGRTEGKQPGFLRSSGGSPRAHGRRKGRQPVHGARGAECLRLPRGTGWQRPSRSCQGYTFSFQEARGPDWLADYLNTFHL